MLVQRGRKRSPLPDRFRDLQYHLPQGRILLLLTQPVQGLRDGNGRAKQRAHLASERRNLLPPDPPPEMLLLALGEFNGAGRSGSAAIRGRGFECRWEKSPPAQKLEGSLAVLGFDHSLYRSAARLD